MSPEFIAFLVSVVSAVVMVVWWRTRGTVHALHDAAAAENLGRMEKLISAGAGLDTMYDGVSPLHVAVMRNRIEAARLLISHGASVNMMTDDERCVAPLHIAATTGNLDMVELLLTKGADIHGLTSDFEPPVLTAARCGHKDVFTCLLSNGATLQATDANGNTMLFTCILAYEPNAADMLLEAGMDPNGQTPDGSAYALHAAMVYAIPSGKYEMVECLLRHGADPNVRDQHGMTPLKMASMTNHEFLADLLKKYGARG